MSISTARGTLSYLRVHERGTKYGPPGDELDAEVIVKVTGGDDAYGFQLRADANLPVREAMLTLLREAFTARRPVLIDYVDNPGHHNLRIYRVILLA
ncbi:hypothetical protein [Nocardioides sp. YIM 152588]|uniref:hypothetical protein n=1 Tax=Nocardioides sp. YIM 152588 TaxID=3158259 RepID=UPI0032E4B9BC